MIPWADENAVTSPVQGEGVVMGRRKLFGYGSRWHCWRIRRRRDAPGGYAALVEKMPWPRHTPRHAARGGEVVYRAPDPDSVPAWLD